MLEYERLNEVDLIGVDIPSHTNDKFQLVQTALVQSKPITVIVHWRWSSQSHGLL